MLDNNDLIHLLANPLRIKKKLTPKPITIDDKLLLLLQKKFEKIDINKEDYDHLIVKIENIFIDYIIQTKIDTIIDSIDE
tara:strand:- start:287 stop:526 length:240 start_codon:yes stop_codon:yes gene_type:complete